MIFLFKKDNDEIVEVDEKTAHNYLRHPTRHQREGMKYIGAVHDSKLTSIINSVNAQVIAQMGSVSMLDDELVMKARRLADSLLLGKKEEVYKEADKMVAPRNYDWLDEKGNLKENVGQFAQLR